MVKAASLKDLFQVWSDCTVHKLVARWTPVSLSGLQLGGCQSTVGKTSTNVSY